MKRFLALTMALPLLACAQPASGDMSKKEVEAIIAEYLVENPEIIQKALVELERREDAKMLDSVRQDLEHDKRDISMGPADAKVTVVEFFDYNCGYCKKSSAWIRDLMKKHPDDVRVVFKEMPILESRSKTSRNASLAALAAGRQGKYPIMHFSLMNENALTPERVEILAKEAGLDVQKWKKDMQDSKLEDHIDDNMRLARRLPALTGTPFFVVGDEYVNGANINKLQEIIEEALGS